MSRLLSTLLFLLIIAGVGRGDAADRRTWELLENCNYIADDNNDGDSFRVQYGKRIFVARLYYIDAPETTLSWGERVREQSEHFGATLDATLQAGAQARTRVQELLAAAPFVVRTRWAMAPGSGREQRFYAIVEAGDRSLAEILVSEGLARTKGVAPNHPSGEKAGSYMERLRALEAAARRERRGLWAAAAVESANRTSPK